MLEKVQIKFVHGELLKVMMEKVTDVGSKRQEAGTNHEVMLKANVNIFTDRYSSDKDKNTCKCIL